MAVAVQSKVSPAQMAAALRRAGFPVPQIPIMVAIGLAESGGRVDAVNRSNRNGSIDYGVWQINSVHGFNPSTLLTLDGNAAAAKSVYDKQGLKAWSTYNSGSYRSFLTDATTGANSPDATASPSAETQNIGGIPNPMAALDWLKEAGSVLISGDFWKRAGLIGLAAVLILLAAYLYSRESFIRVLRPSPTSAKAVAA